MSQALVPMPLRLPAVVAAVLSAATVSILGLSVAGTSAPSTIDTWVGSGVHRLSSDVPSLPSAVVQAGNPGPIIVTAALLAALCGLLRRPYHALLSVTAPATVGVTTTLLKPAIGRTFEGVPAFPSGHTAAVTALSVVAGLLIVNVAHARPAVAVWTATAVVLLVGAAIGSAVVAVNWHYPTDALGGFCTAVALVIALAFLSDGLRSVLSRGWIQQMTIVASAFLLIISLLVLAIDRTRSLTTFGSSSLVTIPSTYHAYPLPVTVPVIGSTSGPVTATISVGTSPGTMAVTPDGRHAYVPNRNSNTVTVIENRIDPAP